MSSNSQEKNIELTANQLMLAIKNEKATIEGYKNNSLVKVMPNKKAANPYQSSILDLCIQKQIEDKYFA